MLPESRSKSIIGKIKKILSIRRTDYSDDKVVIDKEVTVTQVSQERETLGILWFAQ